MTKIETSAMSFQLDLDKWTKEMLRELNKYEAKVGILKDKKHDKDSDFSTAELGAVHEFGSLSGNIPARSFLRLTEQEKGAEMTAFVKGQEDKIIERVIKKDSKTVLKRLALKWLSFVHECFETEGFGGWEPLDDKTLAARERKRFKDGQGGVMILQDTGALERSITYEVTNVT